MNRASKLLLFIALSHLIALSPFDFAIAQTQGPAQNAQEEIVHPSVAPAQNMTAKSARSSSTSGKYQKRFAYYAQMIDGLIADGNITDEQAATFRRRLQRVRGVETYARRHQYNRVKVKYLNHRIILLDAELKAAKQGTRKAE